MSELGNNEKNEYNKEYNEKFTVAALKEMLRENNLPVSGQKDEPIEKTMPLPEFSNKEAAECEEDESDDKSEDDKGTNQG